MSNPAPVQSGTTPVLKFHQDFATRQNGDIILSADDDTKAAFYFPHTLLSALSNFFATLPSSSPSPADSYNGDPVIPLLDSTSLGLHTFLLAVRSITTLHRPDLLSNGCRGILGAAEIAMRYQTPVVIKLLAEALTDTSCRNDYLRYALWVIVGDPVKVQLAAKATVKYGMHPELHTGAADGITDVDPHLVAILKRIAPLEWARLQDWHLRRIFAVPRWQREIVQTGEWHVGYGHDCLFHKAYIDERVKRFNSAQTVEEILEILPSRCYGETCPDCVDAVNNFYGNEVEKLRERAGSY